MTASSPCACARVRRASRALTRLYDGELAGTGLTVTQFAILRSLTRLGSASVGELAKATGHERSAMTRALRPLADAGFVDIGAGTDRRRRGLCLTAAGRAAMAAAEPGWRAAQARIDASLGATERAQLFALLAKVERLGLEAGR
jgi:DNA-binding MarR family transcriptional regulator